MKSYEIGINRFIKDDWSAVKAGYRPSYMDCVSFAACNSASILKLLWETVRYAENPWHLTLAEICFGVFRFSFLTLLALTYPLSMWLLAWRMKQNIDYWVKQQETAE